MNIFKLTLALVLLSITKMAIGQCNPGATTIYGMAYTLRSGASMYMDVSAYSIGIDSQYDILTINQTNTYNGNPLGSPISQTGPLGYSVESQSTFDINATGFGTYTTNAQILTYDSCTGQSFPPYSTGQVDGIVTPASTVVTQPTFVITNKKIYDQWYLAAVGSLSNVTNLYINPAPPSGVTATWTITGNTAGIQGFCTSCNSMLLYASQQAQTGCTAAFTAQFTLDGLNSAPAGVVVVKPTMIDGTSPFTNQHVDHLPLNGGYDSVWYFQNVDECGSPMPYARPHESFPGGFTYLYTGANWAFPTANSWIDGDTGGFKDDIGESGTGALNPPLLGPQNPLQFVPVYSGAQQFVMDIDTAAPVIGVPYTFWSGTQTHYQDHGDHQ